MIDPMTKFDEALTAFAQSGNRWSGVSKLTYWAAASGLTEDEVLDAAHDAGVRTRDTDIRRSMVSAVEKVRANAERFRLRDASPRRPFGRAPKAKKPDQTPPDTDTVRKLIDAGRDVVTDADLRAMSPTPICVDTDKLARMVMAEMQLLAMFAPSDVVRIRKTKADNSRSVPSVNLKPLDEWLHNGVHPVDFGEIVRVNPLSGKAGLTKDKRPSFDAQSCVAAFRHMVIEFDDLPLDDQRRFWAGFVRRSPLAKNLVCLVGSGARSVHGVLAVDAADEETWTNVYRPQLLKLFASDPDKRYRLDDQALMPLTGCRLAGARRADTGEVQPLLYVRSGWRDTDLLEELNPTHKPPVTADGFDAHCATCQAVPECRRIFGAFWRDKSSGGIGCKSPISTTRKRG